MDDMSDGRTAGVSSADERPGSRWLPGSVGSAVARRFCRLLPCRTGSVRSSAARIDALPLRNVCRRRSGLVNPHELGFSSVAKWEIPWKLRVPT